MAWDRTRDLPFHGANTLLAELPRPVMRQIYSALTIYVLLHVLRCLVCKLNSPGFGASLMKKYGKNEIFFLQISYAHDSRHFDFMSNVF